MASSMIMTNNISVTFLAFALGMTFGLGTIYIMAFNGLLVGTLRAHSHLHGRRRRLSAQHGAACPWRSPKKRCPDPAWAAGRPPYPGLCSPAHSGRDCGGFFLSCPHARRPQILSGRCASGPSALLPPFPGDYKRPLLFTSI
jgi:hypothetical protein